MEVAARRERYLTTRTRLAHLPFQRTFEQFDFAFQPSIDERLVKELAKPAKRPAAGSARRGQEPGHHRSIEATALSPRLRPDGGLRRPEAQPGPADEGYLAPKVLVVDEFGIWPYDRESATAFFTLVSARYERGSIILTSNKGFGEWGELLATA